MTGHFFLISPIFGSGISFLCAFLNFYVFCLLLQFFAYYCSFFLFYAFLSVSSIFFYLSSIVSRLDVGSASASNLNRFCRISH